MIDYSEKRDFLRMEIECLAHYRLEGAPQAARAIVKNLSGNGVLLLTEQPLAVASRLALEVLPGKVITPPLAAYVQVLRCDPDEDGNFTLPAPSNGS